MVHGLKLLRGWWSLTSMNHRARSGSFPNAALSRTAGGLHRRRKPRAFPRRLRRRRWICTRLGFAKARCADTGRPPYDPAVLLKLYLYGYLHRVRSSRMLEAECQRNVEVIWLMGKQAPDFKTIADFRKDNLKPLKAVARQFTLLCRKLELFGGELLAIDGSKFAAVNARDQNFNAAKLQELIDRADARLAEYLPATGCRGCRRTGGAALTQKRTGGEDRGVAGAAGLAQGTAGATGRGAEANQRDRSGHAQDAHGARHDAWVTTRRWPWMPNTNSSRPTDVTNEVTDYQQLANVALEAKANLELNRTEVVADAGYYNAAKSAGAWSRASRRIFPRPTPARTRRGDSMARASSSMTPRRMFTVCPAGAALTYRFSTYELGRELQYYRASGCKTCALKSRCTRNKANRTITREANEHLMEAMAARMKRSRRSSS